MFTECAKDNYRKIADEARRRRDNRLAVQEADPNRQLSEYLNRVSWSYPDVDLLTDVLIAGKDWDKRPEMVVAIPVAGFGGQEPESIRKTLETLSGDRAVRSGEIGLLVLANRPSGKDPDRTIEVAKSVIFEKGLNAIALDCVIPTKLGNVAGPFSEEMALEANEVPIALIRDMLSISAMKLYLKGLKPTREGMFPPVVLQMDGDFQGFAKGGLNQVLEDFNRNKNVNFVQYTSDWDSDASPTRGIPLLWLGSELMREIPQILKLPLNLAELPEETRKQIVFGEAIQRGIQVPQAERMESIARKAGYGLSRIKEDELDANIRMAAYACGLIGVNTSDQVVFKWSNRRAVASWKQLRQPPISQWVSSFSAEDPVRLESSVSDEEVTSNGKSKLEVINKTLARFPIPVVLPRVYTDLVQPLSDILRRYDLDLDKCNYSIIDKGGGRWVMQLNSME